DIHQPLHAGDNGDRGGNEVRVIIGGVRTNLHAVWDTPVVLALGVNEVAVTSSLRGEISGDNRHAWGAGTAADWANESMSLAKSEIYSVRPVGRERGFNILPRDYAPRERQVTSEQLKKAGVRLAWILNRIFP